MSKNEKPRTFVFGGIFQRFIYYNIGLHSINTLLEHSFLCRKYKCPNALENTSILQQSRTFIGTFIYVGKDKFQETPSILQHFLIFWNRQHRYAFFYVDEINVLTSYIYTTFYDIKHEFWNRNYWMLSVPKKKVFSIFWGFSIFFQKNAIFIFNLSMQ